MHVKIKCKCELCIKYAKHVNDILRTRELMKNQNSPHNKRMAKFSKELEEKKHRSDIWLQENWKDMLHIGDRFNSYEGIYIPDLINRKFKYIVESDGGYHNTPEQQKKDKQRDIYFENRGYKMFHVPAFDMNALISVKNMVKEHKTNFRYVSTSIRAKQNRLMF